MPESPQGGASGTESVDDVLFHATWLKSSG